MVYRCIPGLREVGFIKSPSPPLIPLLDTNMQIRGEALAVYYEENDFHLTLKVRAGQVLRELQKFVDGKENSIATCVRQIIFTIDQRSVGSLGNTLGYGVLDYLRFRFLSMEREERNPARELDRLSARKEFIERALVLGPGPMFIHGKTRNIIDHVFNRELTSFSAGAIRRGVDVGGHVPQGKKVDLRHK